ncbi:uncharacterized protein VP01_899g7 [Puccinia sorghi]|uniref:CCHC-type domain-containing protein n=1 Tax=Puccinia sorghi TaxID=27349 RepID=A0A0L6U7X5_9BASI|nr:uncharacterized protein VP01_899g7 [Puccinia sorghi]
MDGEVKYAVKRAKKDICDKTRLGRRRFQTRNQIVTTGKVTSVSNPKVTGGDKDEQKMSNLSIKCYTCGETGHTSRRCGKNVKATKQGSDNKDLDVGSDLEDDGPIIGGDSIGRAGRDALRTTGCC